MSIIELLNGAVEVPWVVVSDPKALLTFFVVASAEKNHQGLTDHFNMPDIYRDRFNC